MKGYVPTPDSLADDMVKRLFEERPPDSNSRILYPGVGSKAPFIQSVFRWCESNGKPVPEGIGIESDPSRLEEASDQINIEQVKLREHNFLAPDLPEEIGQFEYIIGNPPYVSIEKLSKYEKERYKSEYATAKGRFDLYLLFFERGLELLASNGRLVFVTSEKYEYVRTADVLRQILTNEYHVHRIDHIDEDSFPGYRSYPAITTVDHKNQNWTQIHRRNGEQEEVILPTDGSSWAPVLRKTNGAVLDSDLTLGDVTTRISPGIATGRDGVFIMERDECPSELLDEWTYPTVSGRQLSVHNDSYTDIIVCPYDEKGNLIPEEELGTFKNWANIHRSTLEKRSCVENGKPWYSFHETPPMDDILQQKIIFKDVAKKPEFYAEPTGTVLPRHTVYYAIPHEYIDFHDLLSYLNSAKASTWIESHAQKAHGDYYRLQSNVLMDLPIPDEFGEY